MWLKFEILSHYSLIIPINPTNRLTELKAIRWNRVSPSIIVVQRIFPHVTVFLSLRIELRSLGKIAEGEELTVSYVDYLNLSEERRRLLKTQYFFDCTCEHCKNRTKDDLKMAGKEVDGVKVCVHLHNAKKKHQVLSPHLMLTWMISTDRKHEK